MDSSSVTPDPASPADTGEAPAQRLSDKTRLVLGWVGIVIHSTVVALQYYLSLLVTPAWGAFVLWGVWALFLLLAIHLLRRRSPWTLAVPFAAFALWFVLVTLGEQLLGWTA